MANWDVTLLWDGQTIRVLQCIPERLAVGDTVTFTAFDLTKAGFSVTFKSGSPFSNNRVDDTAPVATVARGGEGFTFDCEMKIGQNEVHTLPAGGTIPRPGPHKTGP